MRFLALSLLLVLAACGAPSTRSGAHDTHASTSDEPNRDPHGERDVGAYIARLESAERLADLQVDVVVAKLELPDDAEIADLGCGPGVFATAFAKAAPQGVVYACDLEPRQLDAVRARIAQERTTNVVPVLASPADPHLPPRRLDLVFLGDTYHHLRDRIDYLRKLQGALKPGGRLAILEYKPGKLPVGPPPEHKLAAGVMERELADAGWHKVASFDTHAHHDFSVWRVVHPWER